MAAKWFVYIVGAICFGLVGPGAADAGQPCGGWSHSKKSCDPSGVSVSESVFKCASTSTRANETFTLYSHCEDGRYDGNYYHYWNQALSAVNGIPATSGNVASIVNNKCPCK